ncbi:class I SAM-dependent methyltransferase [Actinomadura fulvescens]
MATMDSGGRLELDASDFDAMYRQSDELGIGAVWDIGRVQPQVRRWHEEGLITGPVLDAGCGAGSISVWLARHGYQVTAVDYSTVALEKARDRARAAGVKVTWARQDATRLTLPDHEPFATALDAALYHCLPQSASREQYLDCLHRVTRPDARLLMMCFADTAPPAMPGPSRISREELHTVLPRHGWTIESLQPADYLTHWTPDLLKKSAAAADIDLDASTLPIGDDGYVPIPVWTVVAHRVTRR